MGRETHPQVRVGSRGPTAGSGGVGRPSWWAVWGWEALPVGREGSGGPSEEPGGVGRAGRCREAFPQGAGEVRRPSRMAGKG